MHRAYPTTLCLACVLLAASVLQPAAASADRARVSGLAAISGRTPFGDGCGLGDDPQPSTEAEPYIAVNPRNPRNLIAIWQQDRFVVDGGALSNLVATSRDGGRTWKRVRVPDASVCTGGSDERTSDPWVTIGPDGTAYLGILTFDQIPAFTGLAAPTQQRASRSLNGGRSFRRVVTVVDDGTYNDREAVTADPTRPGHAYFVWVKRYGALGESGVSMFSRTTDRGRTWSAQQVAFSPPTGTIPDPILIDVLPDGTLLNFFLLANLSPFLPEGSPIVPWRVMVMRSTDQGSTWSLPVEVGSIDEPFPPHDPDTGAEVRAYPVISADIARDGTAYVVWNEIRSERESRIFISRSRDGGIEWSEPHAIAAPATQAFIPSVAVARNGTVGVTWDDFRRDRRGDDKLTTDVWFAHSHNRGRTWRRTHLAGPFDMLTASRTSSTAIAGRFVGDYQGLAAGVRGFVAAFAHAKPLRPRAEDAPRIRGPSDILFARIRTGRAQRR
jgi:BNR repeat-like domain